MADAAEGAMDVSNYVYDQAWEHERERLAGIEAWLDPGTRRVITSLGIREGSRCLEAGAGGGSIAEWLCEAVGGSGRVVATDLDTRFLDRIERANLEVRRHDVVNDDLEDDAYDLIHARMLLEHLPARNDVLARFLKALRPGGHVLIEDMDFGTTLSTPVSRMAVWPERRRSLMRKMNRAVHTLMSKAGYDAYFAGVLPAALTAAGYQDVGADTRSMLLRGGTPEAAFSKFTIEAIGPALIAAGSVTERDIRRALENVTDPNAFWMSFPIVAAWGRKA